MCHNNSDESDKVPVGDLMDHAVEEILVIAAMRGIPIQDMTGE